MLGNNTQSEGLYEGLLYGMKTAIEQMNDDLSFIENIFLVHGPIEYSGTDIISQDGCYTKVSVKERLETHNEKLATCANRIATIKHILNNHFGNLSL